MSNTTEQGYDYNWDVTSKEGDAWTGETVSTECPVEILGEVDDMPFIFMARYLGWTFAICEYGQNPRDVITGDIYGLFYREGNYTGTPGLAGLMTSEQAWELLEDCIDAYRVISANMSDTASTIPVPPESEIPTLIPIAS